MPETAEGRPAEAKVAEVRQVADLTHGLDQERGSVEAAVAKISGMLSGSDDPGNAKVEGEDAIPDDGTENGPEEDSDSEDKPEEDGEEKEEVVEFRDRKGNVVKATLTELNEWRENGLRQSDYTRNIQIAKQKQADADRVESSALTGYSEGIARLKAQVMTAIAPEFSGVNWDKLAEEDPAAYNKKLRRWNQLNGLVQQLDQEANRIRQDNVAKRHQSFQQAAQESREILEREISDWSNDKYHRLMQIAIKDYGYPEEEVLSATDHRAFRILNDLAYYKDFYNKVQKGKPQVEKQITTLPRMAKSGVARPAEAKDLVRRVRATGAVEDGVAAVHAILSRR